MSVVYHEIDVVGKDPLLWGFCIGTESITELHLIMEDTVQSDIYVAKYVILPFIRAKYKQHIVGKEFTMDITHICYCERTDIGFVRVHMKNPKSFTNLSRPFIVTHEPPEDPNARKVLERILAKKDYYGTKCVEVDMKVKGTIAAIVPEKSGPIDDITDSEEEEEMAIEEKRKPVRVKVKKVKSKKGKRKKEKDEDEEEDKEEDKEEEDEVEDDKLLADSKESVDDSVVSSLHDESIHEDPRVRMTLSPSVRIKVTSHPMEGRGKTKDVSLDEDKEKLYRAGDTYKGYVLQRGKKGGMFYMVGDKKRYLPKDLQAPDSSEDEEPPPKPAKKKSRPKIKKGSSILKSMFDVDE